MRRENWLQFKSWCVYSDSIHFYTLYNIKALLQSHAYSPSAFVRDGFHWNQWFQRILWNLYTFSFMTRNLRRASQMMTNTWTNQVVHTQPPCETNSKWQEQRLVLTNPWSVLFYLTWRQWLLYKVMSGPERYSLLCFLRLTW